MGKIHNRRNVLITVSEIHSTKNFYLEKPELMKELYTGQGQVEVMWRGTEKPDAPAASS